MHTHLVSAAADTPPAQPWWKAAPPASGSIVMATGIVSIDLHVSGFEGLSDTFLVVDVAVWVVLAAAFATRALLDPRGWVHAADTPPALTSVAGTCVLGTRLALGGRTGVAAALLVIAVLAWPWLLGGVLRHWKRGMPGAVFLVTVSTQGVAVLAGTLAPVDGDWLAWAALCVFVLGLVLYVAALLRFDVRQVLTGAGDHWIAAGALSISAVAGTKLVSSKVWTGTPHDVLRIVTLVVLGFALAWYAVLAVCEFLRPRLGYDIRRWATVFPLGMTAAACLLTSIAAHVGWLDPLGRVLMWVAVVVWCWVGAGLARRLAAVPSRA